MVDARATRLPARLRVWWRGAMVATLISLTGTTAAKAATDALAALGAPFRTLMQDMVVVPGGRFTMGDLTGNGQPWEHPAHAVRVHAFRLSRYDVTIDQYDVYAHAAGIPLPFANGWGRGRRPVVGISWDEAHGYITWLNRVTGMKFRLPSEAEWEYAARAGTRSVYPWGNKDNPRYRNGAGSVGKTTLVGQYPANAFGLYDMVGNVWQWTEDCWHEDFQHAPDDGRVWAETDCKVGHVHRGGSWDNDPTWLRVAVRGRGQGMMRFNGLGFRLALDQ